MFTLITIIVLWVVIYLLDKSQKSLWFGVGILADVFGFSYLLALIATAFTIGDVLFR